VTRRPARLCDLRQSPVLSESVSFSEAHRASARIKYTLVKYLRQQEALSAYIVQSLSLSLPLSPSLLHTHMHAPPKDIPEACTFQCNLTGEQATGLPTPTCMFL
jgi:hypothetical protein